MATQTIELTADNVMQLIEQMPKAERLKLRALFDRSVTEPPAKPPRDKRVPSQPMPDRTCERQWVEDHKHEYPGQWVALDGDRLIAASTNEMEVWDAVDADGAHLPLVLRVPAPDDLPFMGI
jgi:Family of unknown function (DUF5678)